MREVEIISLDLHNPQNPRLRADLNPPVLLIARTQSGFCAEFGPDMQESSFWRNVSNFLGPRKFGGEFGAVPMAV
jgi:hypothetical protein